MSVETDKTAGRMKQATGDLPSHDQLNAEGAADDSAGGIKGKIEDAARDAVDSVKGVFTGNPTDHTHAIDVSAPVRVAYNQWTQFEEFPRFMDGVESVTQLTDERMRWKVKIAGVEREFGTTITEQTPDHRIAWTTDSGPSHAGVVTFHKIDDDTTRVSLQMDYDPDGFLENVADKIGLVSARLKGDLDDFKALIEDREAASGAWRSTISQA